MAGQFDPDALPELAGSYFRWEAVEQADLPLNPAVTGVVADVATWGPINTVVQVTSWAQARMLLRDTRSPLAKRVYDAFRGQGYDGRGGAGAILMVRLAVAAAARAATITLRNATRTGVTLTARYTGTAGNALRATVRPGVDVGTSELLILDGALQLEKHVFTDSRLAELVQVLNDRSGFVTARLDDGTDILVDVAAAAATGGDDGATLTAAEYTAHWAQMEAYRWRGIAHGNLTDPAIRASFAAWIKQRNARGRRCFGVVGGAAAETVTTANARAAAINDPNMLNLGVGTIHDEDRDEDISTAQFAARYLGGRLFRGERADDIYMRFAGITLRAALSPDDEVAALRGGTIALTRDTHAEAPVFIREAVTAYVDDSDSDFDRDGNKTHPVWWYRRIKNVAIQHGIELELDEWASNGDVLGELGVSDQTRAIVVSRVRAAYQAREDAEILQPGWVVEIDPNYPVSDDDDRVFVRHAPVRPRRALRQIFHTIQVG